MLGGLVWYQLVFLLPLHKLKSIALNMADYPEANTLAGLNTHCLIQICHHLPIRDLHTITQVTPRFNEILQNSKCVLLNKTMQACVGYKHKRHENASWLIKLLANVGQHIKTLFIDLNCSDQVHQVMDAIQQYCTGTLKHLHIQKWNAMNMNNYLPLLSGLRAVYLVQCHETATNIFTDNHNEVPNQLAIDVLQNVAQLEVFSMMHCLIANVEQEDQQKMPVFVQSNPKSRRLELTRSYAYYLYRKGQQPYNIFAGLPNVLCTMQNLQFLTLYADWTRLLELAPLAEIRNLRSLHLSNYIDKNKFAEVSGLLQRTFKAFRCHELLEELVLISCGMSVQVYEAVAEIATLRHFGVWQPRGAAMEQAITSLASHGNYRTVVLGFALGLTDFGLMAMVEACPQLEMIDVTSSRGLTSSFKTKLYDWLLQQNQEQSKRPFELHVYDANNPMQICKPSIDSTTLRVVTDPKTSRYYSKPVIVQSDLDERQREHICNEAIRLPSFPLALYLT